MQSAQESKQELQAAIRYAENAISSAKTTIESMEFRQEMAKKDYQKQTSLEVALEKQNHKLMDESVKLKNEIAKLKKENANLEALVQGQADDEQVLRDRIEGFRNENRSLLDEVENLKIELKDQREFDEEVRQGVNDFLDYLDTIGYERP
jgi:chromosome segregation ATPase